MNVDSLNMGRAVWRNRYAALPVLALTVLGIVWALFLMPASYHVKSTLLILPPPPAPNDQQIDRNPALAGLKADNPYARQYDPTILIAITSAALATPSAHEAIEKAGGDDRYTVMQSSSYGLGSPIADIVTTASSPEEAVKSNNLVIRSFKEHLGRLQGKEDVSSRYYVTIREPSSPDDAEISGMSMGKTVIQIFGLGLVGLFTAVSIGDAYREYRREQRRSGNAPAAGSPGAPPGPRIPSPDDQDLAYRR